MKPKLIDRIKNAIHAFKSPHRIPFSEIMYGARFVRCDECEAKNTKVMYLCDYGACGRDCGRMCEHTTDIRHARNFVLIGDIYWERNEDIDIMAERFGEKQKKRAEEHKEAGYDTGKV